AWHDAIAGRHAGRHHGRFILRIVRSDTKDAGISPRRFLLRDDPPAAAVVVDFPNGDYGHYKSPPKSKSVPPAAFWVAAVSCALASHQSAIFSVASAVRSASL